MGMIILEEVRVLHVKKTVLTIACLNPALANEIKFLQDQIIESINKQFGEKTVEKIKFML